MRLVKKIVSIVLAVLMLGANMSFTFTTHFCGGKAVKSALTFGGSEIGCGMNSRSLESCQRTSNETEFSKKGCCDNKSSVFSLGEDYTKTEFCKEKSKDVSSFLFFQHHEPLELRRIYQRELSSWLYKPPSIRTNRSILFQVFRL